MSFISFAKKNQVRTKKPFLVQFCLSVCSITERAEIDREKERQRLRRREGERERERERKRERERER